MEKNKQELPNISPIPEDQEIVDEIRSEVSRLRADDQQPAAQVVSGEEKNIASEGEEVMPVSSPAEVRPMAEDLPEIPPVLPSEEILPDPVKDMIEAQEAADPPVPQETTPAEETPVQAAEGSPEEAAPAEQAAPAEEAPAAESRRERRRREKLERKQRKKQHKDELDDLYGDLHIRSFDEIKQDVASQEKQTPSQATSTFSYLFEDLDKAQNDVLNLTKDPEQLKLERQQRAVQAVQDAIAEDPKAAVNAEEIRPTIQEELEQKPEFSDDDDSVVIDGFDYQEWKKATQTVPKLTEDYLEQAGVTAERQESDASTAEPEPEYAAHSKGEPFTVTIPDADQYPDPESAAQPLTEQEIEKQKKIEEQQEIEEQQAGEPQEPALGPDGLPLPVEIKPQGKQRRSFRHHTAPADKPEQETEAVRKPEQTVTGQQSPAEKPAAEAKAPAVEKPSEQPAAVIPSVEPEPMFRVNTEEKANPLPMPEPKETEEDPYEPEIPAFVPVADPERYRFHVQPVRTYRLAESNMLFTSAITAFKTKSAKAESAEVKKDPGSSEKAEAGSENPSGPEKKAEADSEQKAAQPEKKESKAADTSDIKEEKEAAAAQTPDEPEKKEPEQSSDQKGGKADGTRKQKRAGTVLHIAAGADMQSAIMNAIKEAESREGDESGDDSADTSKEEETKADTGKEPQAEPEKAAEPQKDAEEISNTEETSGTADEEEKQAEDAGPAETQVSPESSEKEEPLKADEDADAGKSVQETSGNNKADANAEEAAEGKDADTEKDVRKASEDDTAAADKEKTAAEESESDTQSGQETSENKTEADKTAEADTAESPAAEEKSGSDTVVTDSQSESAADTEPAMPEPVEIPAASAEPVVEEPVDPVTQGLDSLIQQMMPKEPEATPEPEADAAKEPAEPEAPVSESTEKLAYRESPKKLVPVPPFAGDDFSDEEDGTKKKKGFFRRKFHGKKKDDAFEIPTESVTDPDEEGSEYQKDRKIFSFKEMFFHDTDEPEAEPAYPEDSHSESEYTPETDPKQISDELKTAVRELHVRTIVTGFFTGALLLLGLICEKFIPTTVSPIPYLILNLIFILIPAGVCFKTLFNGIKALLNLQGNTDSGIAIAVLANIIHSISLFFNPGLLSTYSVHIYTSIAVGALFINSIGKLSMMNRISRNFIYITSSDKKCSVEVYEDISTAIQLAKGCINAEPQIAYQRKTKFLRNFLKNSYENDPSIRTSQLIAPIALVTSVALCVVTMIITKNIILGLTALSVSTIISAPIASLLCVNLPIANLCKLARRHGAMLVGYSAVDKMSDVNSIMIDSTDLFPKNSVNLGEFRTYSKRKAESAVFSAAAIMANINGTLHDLFDGVINSQKEMLPKASDIQYLEGLGLSGIVEGRRILVGTDKLMQQYNIDIPQAELDPVLKVNEQILFLAEGEELIARLTVVYKPDGKMVHEMQRLERSGIAAIIRTMDPLLTPEFLSRLFRISPSSLKVLPNELGSYCDECLQNETDSSDVFIATRGEAFSMIRLLSACVRQKHNISVAVVLQIVSIILGFGLVAFLCCYAGMQQLSTLSILIYEAIWIAAIIIIPKLRKP